MTKEIAVAGSQEFILGFRLAGVKKVFPVEGPDPDPVYEAAARDPEVGILIVSAEDLGRIPAGKRRKYTSLIDPVFITMGESGSDDLREKVKNAIGIDLYK
ncbi:MAG: V-type ATP synthase subunit F [Methanobacteriota archaeon]